MSEEIKKLGELIKDIEIAMLTTEDDGLLHSRPMATQKFEFDGDLWFFTEASSHKVDEINRARQVNVSYADPKHQRYISVSGAAELVRDQAKIKELWNPILKAWFPDGLDDPDLALLRVGVTRAEYWEAPNGKVVQLVGFVKALVTGEQYRPGEHEQITLQASR